MKGKFIAIKEQNLSFAKLVRTTSFALAFLGLNLVQAQTPGFIYKTSTTAFGRSVLDPNGDGYTSPTNAGFSGTDYGTGSELRMISIPVLMGEPLNDLNTGGSGGHTDIANFTTTGASTGMTSDKSVFILKRTVNGIDYLILRYRVGGASTATKGYSVLFDTDGQFGTIWNGNNPGFDREVVYETGNNGRVAVYKHTSSGTQLLASYNVHEYSQRSVALSNAGGDADYFYDFFIPLEALDATSPVRFAAATITSAGSGITGTVSDFNGVDDKLYNNDQLRIMQELINIFPSVTLADLDENFDASGWKMKTIAPVVNSGLQTNATSISGTSREPNGTIIRVYKYTNNFSDSVFIGTTTVNNGTWTFTCTGSCGLNVGYKVFARAYGANKTPSDLSNEVLVANVPSCFAVSPTITAATNSGDQKLTISWTSPSGFTNTGTNVRIKVYEQTSTSAITFVYDLTPNLEFQYYPTSSTLSYSLDGSGAVKGTYFATATYLTNGVNCESRLSNSSSFGNSTDMGVLTVAPTINTTPVFTNTTTINVTNNFSSDAVLILYKNGIEIGRSTSAISANGNTNFIVSNLLEGERLTARAQGTGTNNRLSNLSNEVIVQAVAPTVASPAPVITGSYSQGSGRTVTGTSSSPAGTTIILYADGVQIGTAVVDAYGNWSVSGLTLTSGQVLTAKATESGKLESPVSNSVTVLPPPPSAPVITSTNVLANTTNTLSGTISGNTDSIVLYVDGIRIGSCIASGGNWTLNGINPFELYKGADITAVNFYLGSPSSPSNIVLPIAPDKFDIKDANGSTLGAQTAGVDFDIDVTAQFANNNTFTQYTGKNMFNSSSTITKGVGPSVNFNTGFLNNHTLNLTRAGNFTITTLSENDPSIVGSTSVTINPGPAAKLTLITPSSNVNPTSTTFTTQPIVGITDIYGNLISNDNASGSVTVSIEKQNGSSTITATLSGTLTAAFPTSGGASHLFSGLSINQNGVYVLKFTPTKSGISPVYDTVIIANTKMWYGRGAANGSTDFNNANNWVESGTGGISSDIPADGDNVVFYSRPAAPCFLDQNRTLGSIIIASNNNADSAYFNLNGKILTLQGDLELSNLGEIKADGASSRLLMAGNRGASQNLPKDRFVNDRVHTLTINNPNGVTLGGSNNHIRISDTMTFTNGVLFTQGSTNCIMFEDNATQPTGSDASHIEGKCAKVGNDAFVFPIGRNGKYAPCGISAPALVTDMFCAEYFPVNYSNMQKDGNLASRTIKGNTTNGKFVDNENRTLRKVSNKEYWEIDRKVGTSAVNVSLYWNDKTFSDITSLTGLTVVHYDRNTKKAWENTIGNGAVTPKDNTSGTPAEVTDLTITVPNKGAITMEAVNSFSPFTFGDEDNVSLLPLNLLSFTAKVVSNTQVSVNWKTSNEINVSGYEIWKSNNGEEWNLIGAVPSALKPYSVNSYSIQDFTPSNINHYKLKVIEEGETSDWNMIVSAYLQSENTVSSFIYPNPNQGEFTLSVNEPSTYEIFDILGKKQASGSVNNQIQIQNLSSGVYTVKVIAANKIEYIKVVVE